ncbi:hypothetical protein K2Z84_05275 [Candidatus Binatia bacterium]|nr:hypothetical protein [Candidatus Binatia bacterium]
MQQGMLRVRTRQDVRTSRGVLCGGFVVELPEDEARDLISRKLASEVADRRRGDGREAPAGRPEGVKQSPGAPLRESPRDAFLRNGDAAGDTQDPLGTFEPQPGSAEDFDAPRLGYRGDSFDAPVESRDVATVSREPVKRRGGRKRSR